MPTPRPPPKGPLPANPYEIAVAILYFLFVTPIAILCGVITALRDEARKAILTARPRSPPRTGTTVLKGFMHYNKYFW